ncbi:PAS domain S-box-containing protein [Flavobacterium fluvii]|uniref:Sensory/regulatory protein RpfC n=1 Tax=Flavobacterium fluvii TaxID=468056 RepID=A0A1M5KKC5_9FLAO|nr:PAS domain S-box protein [Flavobacterium fluvii]SHG52633.1 PAS domain S-box-containing protein [Flavobacterium fluvii]
MKFILGKKTTLFYILSVIILTTVLWVFYTNSQKETASRERMMHAQKVISKSQDVLLDAINVETGFRGFLLSRDESFLEPFAVGQTNIRNDVDTLISLTNDSPNHQMQVAALKKVSEERIVFTKKYIEKQRQNELGDLEKSAIIEQGKVLTDKIRNSIASINKEELKILKLRKAENENSNQFSGLLFFLLLVFLVIIFILVILIIKNKTEINNKLETYTSDQKIASQYALSLIEASLDPLVTISVKGKIMDMNQATVNITGVPREQLIGSDFFDYFTEQQSAREVYQEVFEKGSVADSHLTIRHKDGKLTDVLFNGSVFKDEKGNILGVVIVARDIAEQKWVLDLQIANKELAFQNQEKEKRANELGIANEELAYQNEEKENRAAELIIANKELIFQNKEKIKRADELVIADIELDFQNKEKEKREIANKALEALSYSAKLASQYSLSLIEASLDPLVTISTEGKIMDMNEATVNIVGMPRKALIDSDFFDYFTDQQKAREVYQEVFKKGSVADAPLTLRNVNGKLTDVLFNGSVYKDDNGNVLGVVIVARDVTDQKRIETELIEARIFAELATEIAEEEKRNAQAATLIAENAVKAKQQFLSNMSHEIRTPMNAIIGFTKVVLKTDLSVKQKEYLSAIKMSGDALIVLINDILDLAKVDAGKMTFEQVPFKLSASILAMLHIFETKIQEKNLELVTEYDSNIPKVLLGDPVRLHQIILNLVSNAIKFTTKGKITVSVLLLNEDEESATVEFAIADTGIGIDEGKIDTIFDDFQQATSGTSRLYGGTGLGLAIVKQLVEPQGGTVSVKSKIKEGSTFSFVLRFLKTNVDAELETEIVTLETQIRNIKVLVVEDMPLNQLLMKTLLDDFGFEREIAENGKIAIEKLQNESYDVVLMDLQMPVMNGFDATEYIRNTMNSDIPIIALTADVTTVDLAKCKAVGMNDYIAKPVDERLLYSKIVGIVKNKRTPKGTKNSTKKIKTKCTNLDYLSIRTKSNPKLMMEMISIYMEQTPPLIDAMKQSVQDKDWDLLGAAVHKIIPSFSIMGMSPELEDVSKKIQDAVKANQFTEETAQMVVQLETVCKQACEELEIEFNLIKNTKS